MGLDENDTRGWVMSGVSGVACIIGAGIICVDLVIRSCCGLKRFDITTSSTFLSSSMGLSAGVMVFSSLYSMLPTSKQYLSRSGLSGSAAAYVLIGLFLAGVVAISIFSDIVHRYIPSHIVDCTHTHEPTAEDLEHGHDAISHSSQHWYRGTDTTKPQDEEHTAEEQQDNEHTPLINKGSSHRDTQSTPSLPSRATCQIPPSESIHRRLSRHVHKLFRGTKDVCDENGPCYGISQACGTECQKVKDSRNVAAVVTPLGVSSHPRHAQPLTTNPGQQSHDTEPDTPLTVRHIPLVAQTGPEIHRPEGELHRPDYFSQDVDQQDTSQEEDFDGELAANGNHLPDPGDTTKSWGQHSTHSSVQHHHHVPQNAFLSIGLQTSLAIALHKLPEGFITYATNHASPTLGLTVFLALFIHNITDGFALALPLFLAFRSRTKAIVWASLLGGFSQPAGAGLAALWIWLTERHRDPSETEGASWGVYGGMFAITAGIMTSVGLQLFSEGLCLTHNRNICIGSAIAGMGLLGVSFALTA
ncbi:Zinc-regulated transporter 3 [Talaromyces islandicus]|uniref:Zinc-regulated transporter 3 n=1 Tax=Talaromyces islandicus TaxID=28573 RepID=A0A0U1M4N5_TALIS|nr:Zinc-regulated transporter 3 [Talaromyces islandicus]